MIEATSTDFGPPLAETNPPMDKRVMGMAIFIASEAIFFLILLLSYIYLFSDGWHLWPRRK